MWVEDCSSVLPRLVGRALLTAVEAVWLLVAEDLTRHWALAEVVLVPPAQTTFANSFRDLNRKC